MLNVDKSLKVEKKNSQILKYVLDTLFIYTWFIKLLDWDNYYVTIHLMHLNKL